MFEFSLPWLFIVLPLPLVLWRLLPAHREQRTAVSVPFMARLKKVTGKEPAPGVAVATGPRFQRILLLLTWISIVAALARPQWIEEAIERTVPTRDLLLAVDLSGSMATEDFQNESGKKVDRLTAVKQVLDEFLTRRTGDRVGLIFFGSAAFVQAPFTEDLEVCRTLLDEAQVRMAGPKTVLGDAVGLGIHVFEQSETEERVLIVLTDGNDTGSQVPPDKAASIAKDRGIKIFTVAVGDPAAAGEEKLDEETLKAMASITGGSYFFAGNRGELETIYRQLDEMETRKIETISHRPRKELYPWLIAVILLFLILYHVIKLSRRSQLKGGILAACLGGVAALALGAIEVHDFHFLRPDWLYLLAPLAFIVFGIARHQDAARAWRGVIADHLLKHLLFLGGEQRRLKPWHLLAAVMGISVIALAGPTWQREPSPFAEDQAALFVILKVTPSMKAEDIQPSRLERAKHKIKDLLALRKGTLTGLIAYAGSAHLVMPLTRDSGIISSFADELEPEIMPAEGDAAAEAVALAGKRLESAGLSGSILLIADGITNSIKSDRYPVHLLAVTGADDEALEEAADSYTRVTPDERDVERIASRAERVMAAAFDPDGGERWQDFGFYLVPLIALLSLSWYRRGWLVSYS